MLFFKDKTLANLEKTLHNTKTNMSDMLQALSEYIPYLRNNKNTKKENEVFIEIIKAFKDKNNSKIFIGKELLFMDDRRNKRIMLNEKFIKVISSFSSTQIMVFASTIEKLEPYLDFFATEKGKKIRIDFKNIISMKSIDMELFRKRAEIGASNQIIRFLSNKNIFIIDDIYIDGSEELDAKFFYNMIPYMGEKTYPLCYRSHLGNVVSYLTPKEIERKIQNGAFYIPFGQYLDNCDDLNIEIESRIIKMPMNLLERNSNFYIVEN